MCLNFFKKSHSKAAEATDDLIGNKTADVIAKSYSGRVTKVSKNSQQND